MNIVKEKNFRYFKFLILILGTVMILVSSRLAYASTFFGESPEPGMHEYEFRSGRYQVYLPPAYTANVHFPLVILSYVYMGDMEVEPGDYLESWVTVANERNYIIVFPMPGGVIDFLDQWTDEFLKMIQIQYSMKREAVLLTGFGLGGHYALHFAVGHPNDIGAVAVVGGSLEGLWKPMTVFKRGEKPSFYLAGGETDAVVPMAQMENAANLLKKKGYPVELEKFTGGHQYPDEITEKIADWFDELRNG